MTKNEYIDKLYNALAKVAKEQMKIIKEIIDEYDNANIKKSIVDMFRKTFNEEE